MIAIALYIRNQIASLRSNLDSKNDATNTSIPWINRNRKVDQFAPISIMKASESNNEFVKSMRLRKNKSNHQNKEIRIENENMMQNTCSSKGGKNQELSQLFATISKLYKEMPLDKHDEWRSYTYNAASAKLKYLDFQVLNNEESLKRLGNRKGFGKTFMRNIREYLKTGKCQLVSEFEHDPMRVNVRNMVRIWYVRPLLVCIIDFILEKNVVNINLYIFCFLTGALVQ
jgi:hypothetical protein